jgi:hypothetical protein
MDTLPFDVLCYMLQGVARTWFGWELLELRLVCKQFLRACDSPAVMKHWRQVNVDILVWQARTLRFCPPVTFNVKVFASLVRTLVSYKKENCAVASGALVWLYYAVVESVVRCLQRSGGALEKMPFNYEALWSAEPAVPIKLISENAILYSEDDDGSEYVFDEAEWEKEQELELKLDEELMPELVDGWDQDAHDQEIRQQLKIDEEHMPSSWNYLHWGFSSVSHLHHEAEWEECSFPFTDFMDELWETMKSDTCCDLMNERCSVTGMTPLHCLFSSSLLQRGHRRVVVPLNDWVQPLCTFLKQAGADFNIVDNAGRNVVDVFLW